MKINGNAVRPGMVVEHQGRLWRVAKIQHTQPGKGGAYMQVEMKNLQDGRKTNVRFRSADTVEKVHKHLVRLTGKNLPPEIALWQRWWQENRDSWAGPPAGAQGNDG